ncbi:MFS transporter [bacterium]|nr:MFS transporter [bacterium]
MNKKPLLTIFLVVFIDLLGFGLVIPILPYYAKTFGASAMTVGLLMASYSGMQLLFSPFWGSLSDRIGRKPVLLTSIAGLGVAMVILASAQSLAWFFVARLLGGFFGANIAAASAYIADITPPEERTKGMGLIGAAFGMGFLLGPALGGILSQWGYNKAPLLAACLSGVNLLFAIFTLKEPNLTAQERQAHRNRFSLDIITKTLGRPQTGLVIVIFFLVTLGMAQLETSFALFALAKFNLDAFHAGLILALMGFMSALIQGGGIGKLSKKLGETKLITAGSLIMTSGLLAATLAGIVPLFVVAICIFGIGYAVSNPSLYGLVSKNAPQGMQGATMGVYQSAGSLGRILGPLFAGFLFDHWGKEYPFILAAFFFVVVFLLVTFVSKRVWGTHQGA